MSAPKKRPSGRPPNTPIIPREVFSGEVGKPNIRSAVNEIKISSAKIFNSYLKTFKSLKSESLDIYFEQRGITIVGRTSDGHDKTFLHISKDEVMSYYFSKATKLSIGSIARIETLISEIDENTRFAILYTTEISEVLKYEIQDEKNDIDLKSSIEVETSYDFKSPEIGNMPDDISFEISGYNSANLKKVLSKKELKKANYCKLIYSNETVTIEYNSVGNRITRILLNSRKSGKIHGKFQGIYSIEFPKSEVIQFLNQAKDNIDIKFTSSMIILSANSMGISIRHFIEIILIKES